MAQYIDEGQVENTHTQLELKEHLAKFNVPETVYKALSDESITVDELITFTIEDLTDWCNEHSLKIIERRRFVNAVKALPNSEANKPSKPKIVEILLDTEEKEQLSQLDEMKNGVRKTIDMINTFEIEDQNKMDEISKEIRVICDEFSSLAEKVRKHLLQELESVKAKRGENIMPTKTSFENLLESIESMFGKYKSYLGSNNFLARKSKDKHIETEMKQFKTQFNQIVSENLHFISDNFVSVRLTMSANETQEACAEMLEEFTKQATIKVDEGKENERDFETNFAKMNVTKEKWKRKKKNNKYLMLTVVQMRIISTKDVMKQVCFIIHC